MAGIPRRQCLWSAFKAHYPAAKAGKRPPKGPAQEASDKKSGRNAGTDAGTVTTIAVTGKPERPASGSERWRAIARNIFPFVVVGTIWEIVALAGVFPHRLFPTLEEVAHTFVQLTVNGILPHHAIETVLRLLAGFALAAIVGVTIGVLMGRSRRAEDIFLPLVIDRRADPRPRLCAAVPALVRARQFLGGAAGRLRVVVSDHLQQLDRREGGEGNLGALGAIDGRRRPPHVPPRHPAGRAALHPHRPAARPGAGLARAGGDRDAGRRALGPRLDDLRRARIPQHRRHDGRHRGDRHHRSGAGETTCSRRSRTTRWCAGA